MSVYKKLHQVQAATRSLAANAEGQTGAAKYNYVAGAKLLGIIRPLMDKLGLILTQEIVGIENTPTTYTTRNGEKTEMFTTLHIRFTWIDSEDGSTIVNEFYANGMNAWDKGLGSALTYAERYYLMKTFHIATDEDDVDALVKEEAIKAAPAKAVNKPATKAAAPKECSQDTFWKLVDCYAKGIPCKSGKDCRTFYIEYYYPTEEMLQDFDYQVEVIKAQMANQ